ncbi:DUF4192 domain-containing protein [Marinitenerispora sediminis]|uniref:DUF4192 domain-containing protein n=1 Tax=Marinitenerispora sediminis TaxID=1931232 RepID=A0A368T1W0_9ACTN|nr:DUF4192 domain-containing protein [Marinitenerispora sediminis]RCV48928.1 DUF4192 domain-containing protein [Marinitenerispora sediminis]RCV51434.1 DUF4192 domain-containing protein [Marinitenerispora sediminis]RCV54952.1 DUF4192 domain-containing protein [Marinitenerispora sediminis]
MTTENEELVPEPTAVPTSLRLGTPTDVIAAVPYLLGVPPRAESMVLLGLDRAERRVRFVSRCDLPAEPADAPRRLAARMVQPFARRGCDQALIVGYGRPERVTPWVDAVRAALAEVGVRPRDALRVHGGRYWSYLCPSSECCPPEGVAYDTDTSVIPATAVVAGLAVRGDGGARAIVAPVRGAARTAMERATLRAEARCARMWAPGDRGGRTSFDTALRVEGVRAVRAAVAEAVRGELTSDPDRIAWLGVVLVSLRVRDEAWAHIQRDRIESHVRLWTRVLRHVEPAYTAAPGALLAFAAWQQGDRELVEAALRRVHEAEPDYAMAALIRQALRQGVSPRTWRHFTPEWLDGASPVARTDGPGGSAMWPGHRR